jgi:chaperone required for assembly of F1-ATPase
MNWLSIGKGALGFVASIGVGNIVSNIVKSTTPANLNTFNKVTIGVGSFVLSSLVAKQVVDHMNSEIDGLVASMKKEEPKVAE